MSSKAEVGNRIKIARIKQGLTQTELSRLLNVSQATVGCWEIGYTFPKASNLVKLSEILKIPIDKLMKAG